jgi:hypothetical protein
VPTRQKQNGYKKKKGCQKKTSQEKGNKKKDYQKKDYQKKDCQKKKKIALVAFHNKSRVSKRDFYF